MLVDSNVKPNTSCDYSGETIKHLCVSKVGQHDSKRIGKIEHKYQ